MAIVALVAANVGTLCAELAGVAVGADLLTGAGRAVAVPVAAVVVSALVLRSGFHRVEHVLLALSLVFMAYVVAGIMADPDWGAAARGARGAAAAGVAPGGRPLRRCAGDDPRPLGPRLHAELRR